MGQRLLNLVHQDQAQIARLESVERPVDSDELAADFFDLSTAPGAGESLAQQLQHLTVSAAALAGVLKQEHLVEGLAEDLRLLAYVFIATVTGTADDH